MHPFGSLQPSVQLQPHQPTWSQPEVCSSAPPPSRTRSLSLYRPAVEASGTESWLPPVMRKRQFWKLPHQAYPRRGRASHRTEQLLGRKQAGRPLTGSGSAKQGLRGGTVSSSGCAPQPWIGPHCFTAHSWAFFSHLQPFPLTLGI